VVGGGVPIERFEQLEVWQEAHALVLHVYQATATIPADERYGLVPQMRRSAVSVPANIAEGFKRRGQADKAHFYNVAQASLEELRYYLILCRDLGFDIQYERLAERTDRIGRMLNGLVRAVRK